jgi:hypothetical protein
MGHQWNGRQAYLFACDEQQKRVSKDNLHLYGRTVDIENLHKNRYLSKKKSR